jgi:hypothetical protein
MEYTREFKFFDIRESRFALPSSAVITHMSMRAGTLRVYASVRTDDPLPLNRTPLYRIYDTEQEYDYRGTAIVGTVVDEYGEAFHVVRSTGGL